MKESENNPPRSACEQCRSTHERIDCRRILSDFYHRFLNWMKVVKLEIKFDLPILLLISACAAFGVGHHFGVGWAGLLVWIIVTPWTLAIWLMLKTIMKGSKTASPSRVAWLVLGAAIGVLILWAFCGRGVVKWVAGEDSPPPVSEQRGRKQKRKNVGVETAKPYETPGQFGDSFGPITALFSAITLAAAVAAYLSQRSELKLAEIQRFEGTFFQMLDILLRTIAEIRYVSGSSKPTAATKTAEQPYIGSEALHRMLEEWKTMLTHKANQVDALREGYNLLFQGNSYQLGKYLGTAYRIMQHIDGANIPDFEKIKYAKIFRAQMSDQELKLWFLSGLTEASKGMVQLIAKYGLFKYLPPDRFPRKQFNHVYSSSAYTDLDERVP